MSSSIPVWRRQKDFVNYLKCAAECLHMDKGALRPEGSRRSFELGVGLENLTTFSAALYIACHPSQTAPNSIVTAAECKAAIAVKDVNGLVKGLTGYLRLLIWLDGTISSVADVLDRTAPSLSQELNRAIAKPFLRPALFSSKVVAPSCISDEVLLCIQLLAGSLADGATKSLAAISDSTVVASVMNMLSESKTVSELSYLAPASDAAGSESFKLSTTTASAGGTVAAINARRHLASVGASPRKSRTLSVFTIAAQTPHNLNPISVPIVASAKAVYKAFTLSQEVLVAGAALEEALLGLWEQQQRHEVTRYSTGHAFEFSRQALAAEVGASVAKYTFLFYSTAISYSSKQAPVAREELLAKWALGTGKALLQSVSKLLAERHTADRRAKVVEWKEYDLGALVAAPIVLLVCGLVHTAMYNYHKDPPVPSSLLPHVLPPLMMANTLLDLLAGSDGVAEGGVLSQHQRAVLGKYFNASFYQMLRSEVQRLLTALENENSTIFHETIPPKVLTAQQSVEKAAAVLSKDTPWHLQLLQQANVCLRELAAGNVAPITYLLLPSSSAGMDLGASHSSFSSDASDATSCPGVISLLAQTIRNSSSERALCDAIEASYGFTSSIDRSPEAIATKIIREYKAKKAAEEGPAAVTVNLHSAVDHQTTRPPLPIRLHQETAPSTLASLPPVAVYAPAPPLLDEQPAQRKPAGISSKLLDKMNKKAAKHDRDEQEGNADEIHGATATDGPIDTKRRRAEPAPVVPTATRPTNVKLSSKFDAILKKK